MEIYIQLFKNFWQEYQQKVKTFVSITYIVIGFLIAYSSMQRLYLEGAFGNETHMLFLMLIGLKIGLLQFFASVSLIIGQSLSLFKRRFSPYFTFFSYLFTITTIVNVFLIDVRLSIWGYFIDSVVFSIIYTIFYLPAFLVCIRRDGFSRLDKI